MFFEKPERGIGICHPSNSKFCIFLHTSAAVTEEGQPHSPHSAGFWVLVTAAVTREENPELSTAGSWNFWAFSHICMSIVGARICVHPAHFQLSLCACSNVIYRGHNSEQAPLVPGARETKTAQNPCPGNVRPEQKNTDEKRNAEKPNPKRCGLAKVME